MKLSIALTTYNGARYLEAQLASLVRQTRPPDEVVICDENSSDGTGSILAAFEASAPFAVRVVINEAQLGIIANFEKAVGLCTGDIIFLADQDDSWHPDKLARHEAIYADRPEVGLVFSDAEVVDRELKPLGMRMSERLGITPARLAQLSGKHALNVLIRRPFLLGCTISFRASLRPYLDPFPTDQLHDNWIPFALATVTRFQGIADPLIDYRSHDQQTVGVHTLRTDQATRSKPTRAADIERQLSIVDTLERQIARFRDQVQIPDIDQILRGKRRFLERRLKVTDRPLPSRLATIVPSLLAGDYFRYAGYPKGDLVRDLKGI